MPFNNPIPDDKRRDQKPRRDSGGLATLVQAEKLMQIAILLPSAAFIGWLLGAWGVGTYRQNDSVDVRYEAADGSPRVAEALEIEPG